MSKIKSFLVGVLHELQEKVVWPTANVLYKNVGLVLIGSLLFALLVGMMDYGVQKVLARLYGAL